MSAPRRPHRGKRGHEEEHEANHERWLLTYADMITLLMVLFIVLFASSTISAVKFAELADGLAKQFGSSVKILPGGTGIMDGGKTDNADAGQQANNPPAPIETVQQADAAQHQLQQLQQEQQTLAKAEQKIEAALKAKGLQNSVVFTINSRGLIVSIVTDKVLFNIGKADLQPVGQQVLDAIGPALRSLPNDISVEGHTDNVPITGGEFASNWELSAVRATTVLRYLITQSGLQEDRMSATGYADTEPRVPNDSDAHRAENRRVDVVVMSSILASSDAASTGSASSISASTVPNAVTAPSTTTSTPAPSSGSTSISPTIPGIAPSLAPNLAGRGPSWLPPSTKTN